MAQPGLDSDTLETGSFEICGDGADNDNDDGSVFLLGGGQDDLPISAFERSVTCSDVQSRLQNNGIRRPRLMSPDESALSP